MAVCKECPKTTDHWSHMACRNEMPHERHTFDALYLLYGPYLCPGVAATEGGTE